MTEKWRLMMQGEYRRDGWGFSHRYREPTLDDLIEHLKSMGASKAHCGGVYFERVTTPGNNDIHWPPGDYLILSLESYE